MVVTLPIEARNEVMFIIVGFADHLVSNFPRSQPLILTGKSYAKQFSQSWRTCFLWFVVSGFRIPDSGFRIPDSGFRILGLPGWSFSRKSWNISRPYKRGSSLVEVKLFEGFFISFRFVSFRKLHYSKKCFRLFERHSKMFGGRDISLSPLTMQDGS